MVGKYGLQFPELANVQGRADKFCLQLNRKWMGKDILMK
jgi:hypothetical protein